MCGWDEKCWKSVISYKRKKLLLFWFLFYKCKAQCRNANVLLLTGVQREKAEKLLRTRSVSDHVWPQAMNKQTIWTVKQLYSISEMQLTGKCPDTLALSCLVFGETSSFLTLAVCLFCRAQLESPQTSLLTILIVLSMLYPKLAPLEKPRQCQGRKAQL